MSKGRGIMAHSLFSLGMAAAWSPEQAESQRKEAPVPGTILIYLVRHGQTVLNLMDKIQGWSDSPLTEKGAQGAINLGKGLRNIWFDGVYSSDLARARTTARLIMEQNQAAPHWVIQELPEFREVNFGVFEGELNYTIYAALAADLGLKVPEGQNTGSLIDMLRAHYQNDRMKLMEVLADFNKRVDANAENVHDVQTRIQAGLAKIIPAHEQQGGVIMIVAHGLAIIHILNVMGLDLTGLPPGGLSNSSVSRIRYTQGTYTIECFNDLTYLESGASMA